MNIHDYCKHTDCPVHPKNPNSKKEDKFVLQSEDLSIEIEISLPCLICNQSEKINMKDLLKRAILKRKLKNE